MIIVKFENFNCGIFRSTMLTLLFLSKVSDFLKSSRFVVVCLTVFTASSVVIARQSSLKTEREHVEMVPLVYESRDPKGDVVEAFKEYESYFLTVGPAITDPGEPIPDKVVITDKIAPMQ